MIRIKEIKGKKYYCCSDVAKTIGNLNSSHMFKAVENKKFKYKTNGGIQELSFSTEDEIKKVFSKLKQPLEYKNKILSMLFNDPYVPLYSYREEEFYSILEKILKDTEFFDIEKQYKVGKYRVDFYIEALGLVIEFDEEHHNGKANIIKDEIREKEIVAILKEYNIKEFGVENKIKILRVNHNEIFEGINKIILEILHAVDSKQFPDSKIKEIA